MSQALLSNYCQLLPFRRAGRVTEIEFLSCWHLQEGSREGGEAGAGARWADSGPRAEGHLQGEVLMASPHARRLSIKPPPLLPVLHPTPLRSTRQRSSAWPGRGAGRGRGLQLGGFAGLWKCRARSRRTVQMSAGAEFGETDAE